MTEKLQKYEKYAVYTRYEWWSSKGKTFTKWFLKSRMFDDKAGAEAYMKECKARSKSDDAKTKLKHEYEIRLIDETLLPQSQKMHVGKGRYKKVSDAELDNVASKLAKYDDVVLDSSIGAYVFNTQAHKDYISSKVSSVAAGEKWIHFWHDENNDVHAILKGKDVSTYEY